MMRDREITWKDIIKAALIIAGAAAVIAGIVYAVRRFIAGREEGWYYDEDEADEEQAGDGDPEIESDFEDEI